MSDDMPPETEVASVSRGSFLRRAAVATTVAGGAGLLGAHRADASSVSSYTSSRQYEFWVGDYGAVGDGTTDDTTHIQNCINDALSYANSNGYARVMFDAKHYAISGSQQTAGSAHGQLVIANQTNNCILELCGAGPVLPFMVGRDKVGTILRSTTAATTSGESPSVLVVEGPSGFFNTVGVVIRNLGVRQQDNPTQCAINLWHCAQCVVENVSVEVEIPSSQGLVPSQPTNPNGQGIVVGATGNFAKLHLSNIYIAGHYVGLKFGEHVVLDNVSIYRCNLALGTLGIGYHAAHFGRVNVEQCPSVLASCSTGIGACANQSVFIGALDIERVKYDPANNIIPPLGSTDWALPASGGEIRNDNDLLHGIINYNVSITNDNNGGWTTIEKTTGSNPGALVLNRLH